jgi:hypothetical protein
MVVGLRTLVFLAFCQHPQVLADMGIDWQERAVAPGGAPSCSQVQASRHGVAAVSASRRNDTRPDHRHRVGCG